MASVPSQATALLTSITPQQLAEMRPADRQRLCDECERVYREINAAKIIRDAQRSSGVLAALKDGERSL